MTMMDTAYAATSAATTTIAAAANGIGSTTGASPPSNGRNLDAAGGGHEARTRPPLNTIAGNGQRVSENTSVSTSLRPEGMTTSTPPDLVARDSRGLDP
jgi:hypothetical protein